MESPNPKFALYGSANVCARTNMLLLWGQHGGGISSVFPKYTSYVGYLCVCRPWWCWLRASHGRTCPASPLYSPGIIATWPSCLAWLPPFPPLPPSDSPLPPPCQPLGLSASVPGTSGGLLSLCSACRIYQGRYQSVLTKNSFNVWQALWSQRML